MTVRVAFNRFLNTGTGLKSAAKQVVEETAEDLMQVASISAPVRTGYLRSSIYYVTRDKSTYGQYTKTTRKGSRRRTTISQDQLLPPPAPPPDPWTAYVAPGAYYAVYLEFGTRRMAARPFFFQSVEFMRPRFQEKIEMIQQKLNEIGGS